MHARWLVWLFAGVVLSVGIGLYVNQREPSEQDDANSRSETSPLAGESHQTVTFNRDIAPIVYKQCSSCHHAGEAVPFHLLSYADFRKRAKLVKEVVQRRYMPPWMPAHGVAEFAGERRLSDEQIQLIRNWVDQGAAEGVESDRPQTPEFEAGWSLGKPDFVAKMPQAFAVPAEGKDIYRNFVVPVGLPEGKWIRGVHVRTPGSNGVHHGFVYVDSTGRVAKEKDAAEPDVGYRGMDPGTGVDSPSGQYLSWQPGQQASMEPKEMAWWLPRHSDLVLQMHIRPSGKEEQVQAEVAFYFSDTPPSIQPSTIMLRSVAIDIPAGAKDYAIESSYVVPVDLDVISVLPHAHYLGRKLAAWATLPNGDRRWLMRIDEWNFDWQGSYRYVRPIRLPAGTRLSMRYEYDNSEDNVRNPNHPPRRVTYGLNSSDEMGEFHLQVIACDASEVPVLDIDYRNTYAITDSIATARALLKHEPKSAERMVSLGAALLAGNEVDEAVRLFDQALSIDPENAKARYNLGHAYAMQKDPQRAVEEWKEVVRMDPRFFRAHNNLGFWYYTQGDFVKAEEHLLAAVTENENDLMSRVNLARLYAAQGSWSTAEAELREAIKINPRNESVTEAWQNVRKRIRVP